jgi:hypothetical protein
MLEHLVNVIQKEDLELMFGTGSKFVVTSVSYSTNAKRIVIHSKVLVSEIKDSAEIFPTGLNMLITEGWKYIGYKEELVLVNSLDLLQPQH